MKEKNCWLIVWLDYKPQNKVAIALKSSRSAANLENRLKSISNVTIFGTEIYGECPTAEIIRRYACNIYLGSRRPKDIYKFLN
jgi:hypothetical protein